MPASTLSRRSVALLRVNLDECFGRPINFPRKLHKNLFKGAERMAIRGSLYTQSPGVERPGDRCALPQDPGTAR